MRKTAAALLTFLALSSTTWAQSLSELPAGARLRLTGRPDAPFPRQQRTWFPGEGDESLVGTLVSTDRDTVVLRVSGRSDPVRLPKASIARAEVSRQRSAKGKGALIGFGLGFAGMALAWRSVREPIGDTGLWFECTGPCVVFFSTLGGVVTGLIGAGIAPGERWGPVSDDPAVRLSVSPRPRGGAMTLSFRF